MPNAISGQPHIPDIEVFWNEGGLISIKQEADTSYKDEPDIVQVDRVRARALIKALRAVLREKD